MENFVLEAVASLTSIDSQRDGHWWTLVDSRATKMLKIWAAHTLVEADGRYVGLSNRAARLC
jgi:hypothetical protein